MSKQPSFTALDVTATVMSQLQDVLQARLDAATTDRMREHLEWDIYHVRRSLALLLAYTTVARERATKTNT